MAEDPAAAARAEAVVALLAKGATAARGDAGNEDAVARLERRDRRAGLDDGADRLVAEDRPGLHLGDVAFEDVQVGAADGRGIDPYDCIRRLLNRRVGLLFPATQAGSVIDERLHRYSFLSSRLSPSRARPASAQLPTQAAVFRGSHGVWGS